jgi:hypothetical protein
MRIIEGAAAMRCRAGRRGLVPPAYVAPVELPCQDYREQGRSPPHQAMRQWLLAMLAGARLVRRRPLATAGIRSTWPSSPRSAGPSAAVGEEMRHSAASRRRRTQGRTTGGRSPLGMATRMTGLAPAPRDLQDGRAGGVGAPRAPPRWPGARSTATGASSAAPPARCGHAGQPEVYDHL